MAASIFHTQALAHLLPPSTTRLLLIRHAEVEVRYQRVFGGRIDMDLSPHGRHQAGLLAEWLRRQPFQAIYASPMKRVQQTLAPLLDVGGLQPVTMTDLREVDFGEWTGLGWEAVHEKFGAHASEWLFELERGTVPQGESGASFRARIEPCLRHIIHSHPGETAAIVCHGGVISMILSVLLELPLSKITAFGIDYASVSQLALHPHRVEFELFNFTPWRDRVKP